MPSALSRVYHAPSKPVFHRWNCFLIFLYTRFALFSSLELSPLRSSFPRTFLPVINSMPCSHLCKRPKRRHGLTHGTGPPLRSVSLVSCVNPGISTELVLFATFRTEGGMGIAQELLGSCMPHSELQQKLYFPYIDVHAPLPIPNTTHNRLLPSVRWKNGDYNLVAKNQEWQQSSVTQ